jgi:hypothetical protein
LARIDFVGGNFHNSSVSGPFTGDTVFKDVLSPADEATYNALVAAHQGDETVFPPTPVTVDNQPLAREDGAIYAVPKEASFGWQMCDRDFKVTTGVFDGPSSFEDLQVNPTTLKQEDWNELTHVGVYKDVAGTMTLCTDQTDATNNGTLSIWSYSAKNPNDSNNLIAYEMRDGGLRIDPLLPANERWDHVAYAVGAPGIPGALGGSVRFFDGYMVPALDGDGVIHAKSAQATMMDPTASPAASELRLYIFHPAGAQFSHVFRLVMFRAPGTFA